MFSLNKSKCIYTPYYCEENVWQMCSKIEKENPNLLNQFKVVFISNKEKQIPLWKQKAGKREDGFVVWDYHVILLQVEKTICFFYDLDTTLPFPCPAVQYIFECFRPDLSLKSSYQRYFRVIDACEFLKVFASDRSHMKDENGVWNSPPPNYPPIYTHDALNNISEFISMNSTTGFGKVYSFEEFIGIYKQ